MKTNRKRKKNSINIVFIPTINININFHPMNKMKLSGKLFKTIGK